MNPGRSAVDSGTGAPERTGAAAESAASPIASRPRLRGWLHLVAAPLALSLGVVLIVLAPTPPARWAIVVFVATSVLLFAVSATYHLGRWAPATKALLRRLDHANIFLVIAGTYTPLAVLLLPSRTALTLLATVWAGAVLGIAMRVFWLGAPRWLYVPLYVALGWAAVWFLPAFGAAGGPAVMWLVIAGGLAYTLGAVVYALKRPNPSATWFGFHEVFHACTIVGYGAHALAITLALLA